MAKRMLFWCEPAGPGTMSQIVPSERVIVISLKLMKDVQDKLKSDGYKGRTIQQQVVALLNQWMEEL